MKLPFFIKNFITKISTIASNIQWSKLRKAITGKAYSLNTTNRRLIKHYCANQYFIILINRKSHLTTYLIGIMTLIKTGKWPSYSHTLMNVDSETKVINWTKFKFMEATIKGVNWVSFNKVFDCDGVCLLAPKNISKEEWDLVMTEMLKQEGKEYDTIFDLEDPSRVSCVEMCRNALKGLPDYDTKFANFEKMIKTVGNLTPQMFRDCEDFEVIFER